MVVKLAERIAGWVSRQQFERACGQGGSGAEGRPVANSALRPILVSGYGVALFAF